MSFPKVPLMNLEAESKDISVKDLIRKWENTELPLPVFEDDSEEVQVGEIISLVLTEDNGIHVLKGHFINYNSIQ